MIVDVIRGTAQIYRAWCRSFSGMALPKYTQKIICTKLGHNFEEVTEVVTVPFPEIAKGEIVVKNRFVGINASDINWTAGRYDPTVSPPFDTGFEGIGEIVSIGKESSFKVGMTVGYMNYGAFSDYIKLNENRVFMLPSLKAEYLPLIVSGLTASICLEKVAEPKSNDVCLITAAAGGTGQFAVQLAKQAGCTVIGTASSPQKLEFLKNIGCDRPVNYKTESLKDVIKKEFPNGLDVVYESVGGDMFDTALSTLAVKGRLAVVGYIKDYKNDSGTRALNASAKSASSIPSEVLRKSASVRGFFLNHFVEEIPSHLLKLCKLVDSGKLQSTVDQGENAEGGTFSGLQDVSRAIKYMHSGKNIGKVIVDLSGKEGNKL